MITESKELLSPKKVYLPLTDLDFKIAFPRVEEGDKVEIGTIVCESYFGKLKRPIISTVSGTVVGFEERLDRHNKIVDHIVIENDRLNTQVEVKSFDNPSIMEIRNHIARYGLRNVAADGLYTPISFDRPIQHLVVNTLYANEPFLSLDYEFLNRHITEFIEGTKLLAKACDTKSVTILVDKFMPQDVIKEIKLLAKENNIVVDTVQSIKMNGFDYKAIQKLVKTDLSNDLLSQGVMYTSCNTVVLLRDLMIDGVVPTFRYVAFTGDALNVNALYRVKVGTLLEEIIEDLEGYSTTEQLTCHIGNFLTGTMIDNDHFSITLDVDTVNIAVYREKEEDICIKCGDCNDVCPAGILPQNIMDAELRSVKNRIVELNTDLCTECGLCTYVCPSNINVLEWMRRAKRRVG